MSDIYAIVVNVSTGFHSQKTVDVAHGVAIELSGGSSAKYELLIGTIKFLRLWEDGSFLIPLIEARCEKFMYLYRKQVFGEMCGRL